MSDDASKLKQDRLFINLHERYEVEYWKAILNVTEQQLRDAVAKVGTTAKAVRQELGK